MAWTSGFFNSVNGDRLYSAKQMNDIFEGLITSGVYNGVGNSLVVEANSGMTIQINTGRGFFGGHWVKNESEYLTTLEVSDVTLNRYCAVCVRVDESVEGRKAEPYLKYSEFATNPTKPTMERTDTIKEYCLAYVYIKAGVSEITNSDIEDTRGDNSLCGWVTGLIEQVDTTTLWKQFESAWLEWQKEQTEEAEAWQKEQTQEFVDWFNSLANYLDANAEAKIAADLLALQNRTIKSTGTFDGLGWESQEDGSYTQTISVEGVTPDNDILITPVTEYRETYRKMYCEAIAQGDGTITFSCTNPQDVNVVMEVIIFNF